MVEFSDLDHSLWDFSDEFDVSTVSHLGGVALASALLSNTARSRHKQTTRSWELQRDPSRHRRINTEPLRTLIDYVAFKCHPQCSIARDQAVEGSDIDCGLVVVREPVGEETELAFVAALKQQGFDVCHPTEAQAAIDAWNTMCAAGPYELDLTDHEMTMISHNQRHLPLRQIQFVTQADIEAQAQYGPLDQKTAVYLAGYTIPG